MSRRAAPLALLAAMLLQNLAEGLGGGPVLPAATAAVLPTEQRPLSALLLISIFLVALIMPAILAPSRRTEGLAAMAAGGLALNAVLQLVASAAVGQMLPGSLVGAALMLPAALAVLWQIGRRAVVPALIGMALSPVVLLATWHLAAALP
jgi:hypothetical protein